MLNNSRVIHFRSKFFEQKKLLKRSLCGKGIWPGTNETNVWHFVTSHDPDTGVFPRLEYGANAFRYFIENKSLVRSSVSIGDLPFRTIRLELVFIFFCFYWCLLTEHIDGKPPRVLLNPFRAHRDHYYQMAR